MKVDAKAKLYGGTGAGLQLAPKLPTYVDLFSGAGGLSLGFDQAGFVNLFSIDNDKTFNKTYRQNFPKHKLFEKDIAELTAQEIMAALNGSSVDVVVGGPPCQGFSIAGRMGRTFVDDPRNHLFKEFARVVSIIKPNFFLMENVARLYTHNGGQTRQEIHKTFEDLGYKVHSELLNVVNYGVAQSRTRVIFIGTRTGADIAFPEPLVTRPLTVAEEIGHFPSLKSGESSNIPNHVAMNHTADMLKKMSYVRDGGDRYDIPEELRPASGDVRKYIRYASNKPSVCITGDMRKVFHYRDNRALTVRELARLQSYPDNFVFAGKTISQQQQVGNSVPPKFAYHLAINMKRMIDRATTIAAGSAARYPKVNFIGNKEKIADWICDQLPADVTSLFDAFAGGGSVAFAAKKRGLQVTTNDVMKVNFFLNQALIENSDATLDSRDVDAIFSGNPLEGFAYKYYANKLFFADECKELDRYVSNINKIHNIYKRALAFSLLRRAMIRKLPYSRTNLPWDKIQQLRDEDYSYAKYGRKRAYHNESFKKHFLASLDEYNQAVFDNGKNNKALNMDAFKATKIVDADAVYLDPPYTGTMNDYFGFYGFFDNLLDGHLNMPFTNNFVSKQTSLELFDVLFSKLSKYKYWLLSYNNSSYPDKESLLKLLERHAKHVRVIEKPHVYKMTGKLNKQKNIEYLFIAEGF